MKTEKSSKLKITMFSNAMSHHQKPFCDYMASCIDVDFNFVATKPLSSERAGMGYSDLNFSADYIVRSYENDEQKKIAEKLSDESDFVIYGSAPYSYIKNRIKKKQWTFIYSERVFKKGIKDRFDPKKIIAYNFRYGIASKKRLRVLCASAYAARDFAAFGFKKQQMYKWGYFPADASESYSVLSSKKIPDSVIWVARMISWKHPEMPVELAKKLKDSGVSFHMTMIGNGELFESINDKVKQYDLTDCISFTGALPKDEVRLEMEKSEIFVATSDYNEGWGAVINEGLSSGCAVVVSDAMGASRFLINDRENGLIFRYDDVDELFYKVKSLLLNRDECRIMSEKGYKTISEEWNGRAAGEKLVRLFKELDSGNVGFSYDSGVLSFAEKI